jgi:hypothetical protein
MRINSRLMIIPLLCASSLSASPIRLASPLSEIPIPVESAFALQAPVEESMPPCDGVVAVIRIAEIVPGGSVEKFLAAVEAQKTWYQKHGMDDLIFASKVLVYDATTHSFTYSDRTVMSYHFYSTKPIPPHDTEWDAFVQAFAKTSKIKEGPLTCMPKGMVPVGAPK